MIGSVFRAKVLFEVVTQTSMFCLIFFLTMGILLVRECHC